MRTPPLLFSVPLLLVIHPHMGAELRRRAQGFLRPRLSLSPSPHHASCIMHPNSRLQGWTPDSRERGAGRLTALTAGRAAAATTPHMNLRRAPSNKLKTPRVIASYIYSRGSTRGVFWGLILLCTQHRAPTPHTRHGTRAQNDGRRFTLRFSGRPWIAA